MEARGTIPAPAIGEQEAPDIARLFDHDGPFVTVYLDTDPEVENAAQHSMAHWRNVRRDLEEAGAPATALDAVEQVVPDAHHAGKALAAVADGSGLLLWRGLVDPIARDVGLVGALPAVAPMLDEQQSNPTHVVVQCDRAGADIGVFAAEGRGRSALLEVQAADPHDPDLRKSKPGGWSQRRYQERAENAWEQSAKEVVERLTKVCDIVEPRLVLVGGDVRAVQLLKDHLPPRVANVVREFDGDPSSAVREVAALVAEDTVAVLEKLREELGQHDRAVQGVDATLAALSAARVDTLLVHDDPDDDRHCWFATDPHPPLAAVDARVLHDQGVDDPVAARVVDVAIRTALRTGARVRMVPATTVDERLGAILRF
jgi:hypothetical protein